MRPWQERHKPLPAERCQVTGCYAPVYMRVLDRSGRPHPSCQGHLSIVVRAFMLPDDCLMVDA